MNIYQLSALATIVAAIITVYQFVDTPTSKSTIAKHTTIEQIIKKENIKLSLELPKYSGKDKWLLSMYNAAISMPYNSTKSDALKKVVKTSLKSNDFNMAIFAAKKSPYSSSKAEMLDLIVTSAIKSKDNIAYAVIASNLMPYSSSKNDALNKIMKAYESFASTQ